MSKSLLTVILLWAGYCCAQSKNQLSMFAQSPSHQSAYSANYTTFSGLKWKLKTGGKIFSSPVIYGDVLFIGSEDHNLYAIGKSSGHILWKFATGGAVHSSPAVYKNVVYFGSFDGYYYALNAKTGKLIWKFKTGGEKKVGGKGLWTMRPADEYMDDLYDFFLSSPVVGETGDGLTLYFGSSDGNLYALNALSGKKKWAFQTGGLVHTSPALYGGNLYFGSWDTFLYALEARTGKLKWKFETGKQPDYHVLEGIQASPTCADGIVYFGSRDGYFYALDAYSGSTVWKYAADNSWVLTTAAVKNGLVCIGTSDTYLLLGLDAKTGKEKMRYKTNGYVYSSPALANRTVFFGDFTGSLCAVDATSGKLTARFETESRTANAKQVLNAEGNIDMNFIIQGKNIADYATNIYAMDRLYSLGSIVSSPAISQGVIYFGSADHYLYAVGLK